MKTKIVVIIAAIVVGAAGIGLWSMLRSDSDSSKDKKEQKDAAVSIELNVSADSLLVAGALKKLQVSIRTDDYDQIARVEYLLDGQLAAYSTTAPFTAEIDISGLSPGDHTLQAVAYTFDGVVVKSDIFTFTVVEEAPVEAADDASQNTVKRSVSKITPPSSGGSGSGSGNGDGGGGGPVDTTPWPDEPPAMVCGNASVLSGPTSAPAGAVVVPAGDNNSVDFELSNTTYWFAPGVHTIGTDPLSQIIPGDNSTFVGAPGAIIDGQNINRYAFTQQAQNVTIQYLTVIRFRTPKNEGTVNHDSGVGWRMEYNTVQNNGLDILNNGTGGAAGMFGGSDNIIRYNCLKDNGQYGLQVFKDPGGPQNIVIDHNEIVGNNQANLEFWELGCGCTGGVKFWDADDVVITNNYVHDNLSVGLWADTNDNDFLIEGNYIEGNRSQGIFYEISYNMIVRNNNIIGNGVVSGISDPGFPTGAIYLSEAGGDSRVPARTAQIEIYDNQFVDNWSGVILWENADRFCGSPNNTSTGTCTLVNPAANLNTCKDPALGGLIEDPPYYSDCRWKTQNVHVHDNVFIMDRDNIPQCTINTACGFQGIFSNFGTSPPWTPYDGDVIQQDITFGQNNIFSDNTYIGDWFFKAKSQSTIYNFAIWQNPPYNQDVGSTFNGADHLVVENALDENTATLEGSLGRWSNWFSSTISRSSTEAHTGSFSLKVDITADFGWGVQLNDPAGFPVTPGNKTISFWGKLGSGGSQGALLEAKWLDEDQNLIGSSVLTTLDPITTSWQQATVDTTAPPGVASVNLSFTNPSGRYGSIGDNFYLDDIVVADR